MAFVTFDDIINVINTNDIKQDINHDNNDDNNLLDFVVIPDELESLDNELPYIIKTITKTITITRTFDAGNGIKRGYNDRDCDYGGKPPKKRQKLMQKISERVHGKNDENAGNMDIEYDPRLLDENGELHPDLKELNPELIKQICFSILDTGSNVTWNDIAGLKKEKQQLNEIVIWPLLRPDICQGIFKPPSGILLFGPPGTGKTMIAKAVANECKSVFFNLSSSILLSKWMGQSEKLIKTLFHIARFLSPSIIFIDEIDSVLRKRNDEERDSQRRIKTEFLIQMDGLNKSSADKDKRVLLIGLYPYSQYYSPYILKKIYII